MLRLLSASFIWIAAYFFIASDSQVKADGALLTDVNPLAMPTIGSYGLRVISPTVLELTWINTKDADPARVTTWDFVSDTFALTLPAVSQFTVTANSQNVAISSVGFKRRPLFAPLKVRDLRIGNYLYLTLSSPITDGAAVEVKNPSGNLWTAPTQYVTTADPLRFNPAIHVNQVGYMPANTKKAMVGYYLGSLGELTVPTANGFKIVSATNGAVVFSGTLRQRADVGYTYSPLPYQKVYEADFSSFTTPGEYRLQVPGMGASFSFMINEGVAATFARTFALGLFHQRCGTDMDLPFTRDDHGFCHTNLVDVPTMSFTETQTMIASKTEDYLASQKGAPRITNIDTSLYPFVRQGKIDVSKGHHDAGDYSKYTINSAGLIHHLVFAADSFAGAGNLDNLGIPESGDGKSDLLQEAKWEADFLAKMQDSDGGFYFLVYPKTREYEDDVTPDHGDAQVVWPKTTAVTAAATAALAEIASSPKFKAQFPTESAAFMAKAQLGWTFLTNAIARFGKDGAYQKITHYGNEFMHDDELAWAASAMFAATTNATYLAKLKEWMPDPNSTSIRRWGWWRMFEGYGCATRTYAFAARSGRVPSAAMDAAYLIKCESEITATADDHVRFAAQTAYGTSFPDLNKAYRSAGWYFSSERAFDVTVAYQLNAKPEYKETVFSNLNYEAGSNPVNVSYITGIGWKRQRDIVHQYAQNDRRVLPPSGIPLGNIQPGMPYIYFYKGELTALCFPGDNATTAPYPYYDRWADTFNTMTEFVVMDEARCLGSLAFWMAQSSVATQAWKSGSLQITGLPTSVAVDSFATVSVTSPGLDLSGAQVVWEVNYLDPAFGSSYRFAPKYSGDTWVEAEVLLPDGRRLFAKTNFVATTGADVPPNAFQSTPVVVGPDTAAIYHLDNTLTDATGNQAAMSMMGGAKLDFSNLAWMTNRAGAALRVLDLGDSASSSIPGSSIINPTTAFISVEAMIYINDFKAYNKGNATILSLAQNDWNAFIQLYEDKYNGTMLKGGSGWSFGGAPLKTALTLKTWHHLSLRLDKTGYTAKLNGVVLSSVPSAELANWNSNNPITLKVGDFDGWIDEVVVRSSTVSAPPSNVPPTVSLVSSGVNLIAPAITTLTATATDSDGTIAKVEFFQGATKLGEATTFPFVYAWTGIAAGNYSVTARAIDNLGATTTSAAINVTVTAPIGGGTNTTGSATAKFVKTDATTSGNWKGVYGAEGSIILGSSQTLPAYISAVTPTGSSDYTWADPTTDTRALQKAATTDRIAAVWYAADTFNVDFNFTDANTHRVSIYVMDWDNTGRAEHIDLIDPANNAVLNSADVTSFGPGKYLTWDVNGKVRLRVTRTAGNNAIIEGIFFDVAPKTVKNVAFKVKNASVQNVQLEASGDTGVYTIQSSNDMVNWTNIGTLNMATSPTTFTDTNTATVGMRVYRAAP